jgi:hypothetical protein
MKSALCFIGVGLFTIVSLGTFIARAAAGQSAEGPNAKSSLAGASRLEQQVVAAERAGLDALKAANLDSFADHTADEAVFVDAHGPASKAQVVTNLAGFRLTDYSMDDIRFMPLSSNSGLIVYTITEKGVSHGKEFSARAYISSVWTERGGRWVCLFSQETGAR